MTKSWNRKNLITVLVTIVCIITCFFGYSLNVGAEPMKKNIVYEDIRLKLGTFKLGSFDVEEPENTSKAIRILEKVASGSEGIVYMDMKNVDPSLKYNWKFIVNTLPWGIEDKWQYAIWDQDNKYKDRDIWYFSIGGSTNKNVASYAQQSRARARQIAANVKASSDVETMDAIVDYLQSTVTYGYDEDFTIGKIEYLAPFSTYGALVDKKAVCEGYASAVTDIAMYCGIPCLTLMCEDINHSYNLYLTSQGTMYMLDATVGKKSYPANMNEHDFINDDANDTHHFSSSELIDILNTRKEVISASSIAAPKKETADTPKQYLSPSVTPKVDEKPEQEDKKEDVKPVAPSSTPSSSGTSNELMTVEVGKKKIKVIFNEKPKYNRAGIPNIRYLVKVEGVDTTMCDTYTFTNPECEIRQHLKSGLQYKVYGSIDEWGSVGGDWSKPITFTVN